MRPGMVVYRKKHPGVGEVVARYPKTGDLKALWNYSNNISKERTFISLQGQRLSLSEERNYLRNALQRVSKKTGVHLLLFCDDTLCGNADVHILNQGSAKHTGTLGISIAAGFRGKGLGKLLMKLVLAEAEKHLRGMEIVVLGVFGNNHVAKQMYRRFGFKRYGLLPRGDLHAGKHVAHELMYRNVKHSRR